MDRCLRLLAAIAFAVPFAPAPARAQYQPIRMKLAAWPNAELAGGSWTGGPGPDLLVLQASGSGQGRLVAHQDLLATLPAPYASPAASYAVAVGAFDPGAPMPDVARNPVASGNRTFDLAVTWGADPAAYDTFTGLFPHWIDGMAAIRLLPRPEPLLIATGGKNGSNTASELYAVDLTAARGPPPVTPPMLTWAVPAFWSAADGDTYDQIYPLRISAGAQAGGVEDAIVPLRQGFFLLWHASAPAGTSLASLDLRATSFGATATGGLAPYLPADLASGFDWGSCLGAATIDVDGDGALDLVFSYSDVYWDTYAEPVTGSLLWIRNVGDPEAMAAQRPWGSLMGRADLAAITDTGTLRQIDLDSGEPAFAVQDRARERIVIVRGDGFSGFTTTELPTPGGYVRELKTIDVVGSPAKDLVALVELAPNFTTVEVWVYPDVGDAAPTIDWSPVPPPTAPMGEDLALAVEAFDPDAPPLSLRWMGLPGGDVLDTTTVTIDGASLCDPAETLTLSVRGLDALGVYVTTDPATIRVEERPTLRVVGASPAGRLPLAPGGFTGSAAGSAWPKCGGTPSLAFTWGQIGLSGLVLDAPILTGSTSQVDFTIPESAYPDLLDGEASLTLRATDAGAVPPRDGSAELALEPDARGLVEAAVTFDEAALAAGQVGLARIRLANRLAVPLPAVRVVVRLDRLAFAGPVTLLGASGSEEADGVVLIDPLPARDAIVEILVPVRSAGLPGGVSVELFSQGGYRVSPEASPSSGTVQSPGCGCAPGGGAQGLPILAALAILVTRRRRVR